MSFNKLTDAEIERLSILSEELGEAQQAIGKILRHGYESRNPFEGTASNTNRQNLQQELGDVYFAIDWLAEEKDVSSSYLQDRRQSKRGKIQRYLHHNTIVKADRPSGKRGE